MEVIIPAGGLTDGLTEEDSEGVSEDTKAEGLEVLVEAVSVVSGAEGREEEDLGGNGDMRRCYGNRS